jgi:type IV pilus assembly protein PilA
LDHLRAPTIFLAEWCAVMKKSTLRFPVLKVGPCSGLTLKGAFLPRLKRLGLARTKGSISGFTLIELLIVIAIIGILAAVALPYYRGQAIRAKLTEVEYTMAVLKSAVTSYHHDTDGLWPDCTTIPEISNSLGVGIAAIERVSGVTIEDGVITATIQLIDPIVDGESLILTPDDNNGSLRWTWGWSPGFPIHLRPKR